MRFITEDDLRDLYKIEPFTNYDIEPGTRITPGARQFLADRGINMFDDIPVKKIELNSTKKTGHSKCLNNSRNRKLISRMNSMGALFLLTSEELLSRDVCLAQKVINLSKQFADIKKMVDGKGAAEDLCCEKCTGINEECFSEYLEDCFEINEFHIQLEKGKEILLLHRLRCELHEIETFIMEFYENCEDKDASGEDIIRKINQLCNTLSQMICTSFGGDKCQKIG